MNKKRAIERLSHYLSREIKAIDVKRHLFSCHIGYNVASVQVSAPEYVVVEANTYVPQPDIDHYYYKGNNSNEKINQSDYTEPFRMYAGKITVSGSFDDAALVTDDKIRIIDLWSRRLDFDECLIQDVSILAAGNGVWTFECIFTNIEVWNIAMVAFSGQFSVTFDGYSVLTQ